VIRGAIVHLLNEQPVVVDLLEMPATSDTGLLCTNIRTLDGKKPIFVDFADSVLFFPYLNVRFLEIPRGNLEGGAADASVGEPVAEPPAADDEDLEIDEDFLRRIREA
jgi:hypothetical protein